MKQQSHPVILRLTVFILILAGLWLGLYVYSQMQSDLYGIDWVFLSLSRQEYGFTLTLWNHTLYLNDSFLEVAYSLLRPFPPIIPRDILSGLLS